MQTPFDDPGILDVTETWGFAPRFTAATAEDAQRDYVSGLLEGKYPGDEGFYAAHEEASEESVFLRDFGTGLGQIAKAFAAKTRTFGSLSKPIDPVHLAALLSEAFGYTDISDDAQVLIARAAKEAVEV